MIKCIYHIGDIHIRKNKDRHEEYREVFKKLRDRLMDDDDVKNSVIVCTGDIFHDGMKCRPKVRNYPKTTVGDRPAYTVVYSTPNYMNYNAYIQSRTGTAIVNTSTSAPATAGSRAPANADSAHSAKAEEASAK